MDYPRHSGSRLDAYALYGRLVMQERHDTFMDRTHIPHADLLASLAGGQVPKLRYQRPTPTVQTPVGILGAGIGGLYTALMLKSLDIPYRIIEARDRTGGRLYTYKFDKGKGEKYDYYDVGAMRFPLPPNAETPSVMTRLYHLIHYPPLNSDPVNSLAKKVIKYHFDCQSKNGFYYYNGIRARANELESTTFDPTSVNVLPPYSSVTADAIMKDVNGRFAADLVEDLKKGTDEHWRAFRDEYDKYSASAYMALRYEPSDSLRLPKKPLPTNVINWCETMTGSTSSLTRAFTEAVLDDVVFNSEDLLNVEWSCFDGGSQTLSNAVTDYLGKEHIVLEQPITAVSGNPNPDSPAPITITTGGPKGTTYQFDNVISTLPLPVLRTLNISDGLFSNIQAMAMRQLQYGPSIKIGIRFKTPWWTTGKDVNGNPLNIVGGQSYSDSPLRTVVYPSYGGDTPSRVLIASYCWTNDAERLQALCDAYHRLPIDVMARKQLEDLVLRDLEKIHNLAPGSLAGQVVKSIADSGFYPWNWSSDIHTMGAFAFFGPGQFGDLYESMNTVSPNGKLYFAGEALSTRHAWVVGALDSAWRAVSEYLHLNDRRLLPEFYKKWGVNQEWTKPQAILPHMPSDNMNEDLILEHLVLYRPDLYVKEADA